MATRALHVASNNGVDAYISKSARRHAIVSTNREQERIQGYRTYVPKKLRTPSCSTVSRKHKSTVKTIVVETRENN